MGLCDFGAEYRQKNLGYFKSEIFSRPLLSYSLGYYRSFHMT